MAVIKRANKPSSFLVHLGKFGSNETIQNGFRGSLIAILSSDEETVNRSVGRLIGLKSVFLAC